jgi:hypothetical protein
VREGLPGRPVLHGGSLHLRGRRHPLRRRVHLPDQ